MTEKDRINEADLKDVAGGRSDPPTKESSPQGTPFGDDAIEVGGATRLTPEEAASISGGRSAPTTPSVPTLDDDDPPSIKISSNDPGLGDG